MRADWGLDADEQWVRRLATDPEAIASVLGIPVSREEAADLEKMFTDDPRSRLMAYGRRNHHQYAGAYVDNEGAGPFVLLFTAELERHRAALEALPGDHAFDVRGARWTEEELLALLESLVDEFRATQDVQLVSASLDTIGNVVSVDFMTDDPSFGARLEAEHHGMVRVTTHPIPGPWANVEVGAGWRLLAAGQVRGREGYTVRAATSTEEWSDLWNALDTVNQRPEIALDTEIAVSFGHGIGSSCPEVRLDGVVIDREARLVFSETSDPLAPRACTADLAGAAYFVVALARESLPESPFTVRLGRERICGAPDCAPAEEVEVDLGE